MPLVQLDNDAEPFGNSSSHLHHNQFGSLEALVTRHVPFPKASWHLSTLSKLPVVPAGLVPPFYLGSSKALIHHLLPSHLSICPSLPYIFSYACFDGPFLGQLVDYSLIDASVELKLDGANLCRAKVVVNGQVVDTARDSLEMYAFSGNEQQLQKTLNDT